MTVYLEPVEWWKEKGEDAVSRRYNCMRAVKHLREAYELAVEVVEKNGVPPGPRRSWEEICETTRNHFRSVQEWVDRAFYSGR